MLPSLLQSCHPSILPCSRPAAETDAIDDVMPQAVVEPASVEMLAEVLAWASNARVGVVLRGGGTRIGWGRRPRPFDVVVSTRRLNRVLAHEHGDLTATVEAGAPLRAVNRELQRHRQWLPLDAVDERATIGGAIATNDSGPLRQRYGTPRDLLIGIQLALTDGRVVKAGGNVVKNVAGYDLGKLVSGSFGSLAAIATATFKLAPLPAATSTIVATFSDRESAARAAAAVAGSQLEPSAFDADMTVGGVRASPPRLLLQFASTRAAVDAQIDRAVRLLVDAAVDVRVEEAERECWQDQSDRFWSIPGTIVRCSWLPADLARVLTMADEIARACSVPIALRARAGVGAGHIRIEADTATAAAAVDRLRTSDVVTHVVVVRATADVKSAVDVWGSLGDRGALVSAVKRAFDPADILNAARGPV